MPSMVQWKGSEIVVEFGASSNSNVKLTNLLLQSKYVRDTTIYGVT